MSWNEPRGQQRQFTANVPAPEKMCLEGNLSQNWKRFRRQFENYAIASRLNREEDQEYQVSVFLAVFGPDACEIFDNIKFDDEDDKNDLQKVMEKLQDFFVGDTHEAFESYKFHLRKQEASESIEGYIAALRKLAKTCNFDKLEERLIRDQVVVGVREEGLRQKLLEDKQLTLDKCMSIGRAYESSKQQLQSMSSEGDSSQVQRLLKKKNASNMKSTFSPTFSPSQRGKRQQQNSSRKCSRCGKYPSHNRHECPAKGEICRKCNKEGHFAAMCRTKSDVRFLEDEDGNILGTVTEKPAVCGAVDWHADVQVTTKTHSHSVSFRIDTGADVTVVPSRFFKKNSPLIQKTDKKLFGPGQNKINVIGSVHATLAVGETSSEQELYVVSNLKEPLLGRPAIEALKLIERINSVDKENKYKQEFPELFVGLGRMKNVYTIRLQENAQPFAISTPRRLPLPMKEKVQEELKKLEELDIIRPVETPTDWCAPIVAVPKANGKVRLCIDFTKLNESVRRENFPLPTTDQLLAQLDGATVFTKLDCNSGFHQIPLHPDSQELTTFITPFGRYCYKRLPFGISSGPEVFHWEMTCMLEGIPGVICDIDDVLVFGRNQQEHDDRLKLVLQKMKETGVTLNEKCKFSQDSVKFLGHMISKEGIQTDPEKVQAISNFPRPANISELRRFLGMVNHVGKFALHIADTTKPLRDLLKKETDWIWKEPQEKAFQTIKKQLSSTPVLAHYSPDKPTKVSVDASSYGLGGVLLQKEENDWKPVFYASRSLTPTEQRYAQVEKEALAVTWNCEKFRDYLLGLSNFTVETDHKPLLALLKTKMLDELTPRIQRFRMRLMQFSFNIIYTAGKNLMTADTLSRAPGSEPAEQETLMEAETNAFVSAVIDSIPASDTRLEEVRKKQCSDKICNQIMNFCKLDHWPETAKKDVNLRQYWFVRQDLTVQQGLLLFQSRLVIPAELQEEILQRLHQGHQGVVKCRALARSCVWWPGLSKKIEEIVGTCATCEKERKLPPEPLQPTKTPDYPWQKIAMDLFELNGHTYLIVVDYYSRWIETVHLKQTTSVTVIEHCKSIFARFGIPEIVLSDNGPQFNSREFMKFSQVYAFTHLTSIPIIHKETVKQKGQFKLWKISWGSLLTLTLLFSTTVQRLFKMAIVRQNWWWAENSETVYLLCSVNTFPSNQKLRNSRWRMNTSGTSRNTTMTCVIEQKKPHYSQKDNLCGWRLQQPKKQWWSKTLHLGVL